MSFPSKLVSLANVPAIVVFRYRFIGDTVLSIPFLKALRQAAPNAVIHYVASPGSGEVLTHCPYIDHLWYLDKKLPSVKKHLRYEVSSETLGKKLSRTGPQSHVPLSYWPLAKALRGALPHGSAAFVLKRSWSSALLSLLSGARHRIGFSTEGRQILLTNRIDYEREEPEWKCFFDALKPFVEQSDDISLPELESWWSAEDDSFAASLLALTAAKVPSIQVGLHLTATDHAKTVPLPIVSECTLSLMCQYPQLIFCCVGAASDSSVYEVLRASWPLEYHSRLSNYCGQTSILQSQALLSKLDLFLGVDSGTLHMAAAAKTPVVGLYLENKLSKWLPPVALSSSIPMLTPLTLPTKASVLENAVVEVLNRIIESKRVLV